jgi:hypothetical protein
LACFGVTVHFDASEGLIDELSGLILQFQLFDASQKCQTPLLWLIAMVPPEIGTLKLFIDGMDSSIRELAEAWVPVHMAFGNFSHTFAFATLSSTYLIQSRLFNIDFVVFVIHVLGQLLPPFPSM